VGPCLAARAVLVIAGQTQLANNGRWQLVRKHPSLHRLHGAGRQVEQLEWPEGDADQPVHRQPETVEDGTHLAILAFAQSQHEPHIGALHLFQRGLDGSVAHAADLDPVLELVERLLRHRPMCPHAIAPQPAGRRQLEMPGQRPVVGKQQQPLGVEIQAADGDDARHLLGQRLEHGRTALRIAVGGDPALRLVVAPQARRRRRRQGVTVDQDAVGGGNVTGGALEDLAVYGDAPALDPALRLAPRAQPGAGQRLGDAHGTRA